MSPKIRELFNKIKQLDEEDMKKDGHHYKHFIFSDVKQGGYGSKIVASALIANGMTLAYEKNLKLKSDDELMKTKGRNFALLCSTGVYNKPISAQTKREILGKYNQRPLNVHGDVIRFIVMDSGYKEGIDLFDVKYVHILEPQSSRADEKQVIGRGTRTCGQKGLEFIKNNGWTLEVYIYDVNIPEELAKILDASTLFDLYLKYSNIDLRKLAFSSQLDRAALVGSVDYELNKNIHDFRVLGDEMDINDIFAGKFDGGGNLCAVKNCGARATKEFPINTVKFIIAYFGVIPSFPKKFTKANELRDFLCQEMKQNQDFCDAVNDMNDDIRNFVYKHATELLEVIKARKYLALPTYYRNLYRKFVNALLTENEVPDIEVRVPSPDIPDTVRPVTPKIKSKTPEKRSPIPAFSPAKSVHSMNARHRSLTFLGVREDIRKQYMQFKWPRVELKNMCGGASSPVTFNPTQDFIRHYFTPSSAQKGMLLYHSVGTGKTCTAIATATSSFEKQGYTILWVTRTTLKSDIWKNMFDQICSISIQKKLAGGQHIPAAFPDRMRLLSDSWSVRPMSYKQFSNLIEGKNELYKTLVKRNGSEDPLRKTLLIIDEAHKLYGGADLSSVERPDMNKLKAALMKSYNHSGPDSVKVLLMTATPYTNDPMEFVQLMNLMKPWDQQIEEDFGKFSQRYLDKEGNFTKSGNRAFLDDIAGLVSYLNREKDARQFSQPIVMKVMSTMTKSAESSEGVLKSELVELQTKVKEMANEKEIVKSSVKEACQDEELTPKEKKQCVKEAKADAKAALAKIKEEEADVKFDIRELKKKITKAKKAKKEDSTQLSVLMNKCVVCEKTKTKKKKKNERARSERSESSERSSASSSE
jgi:superfamily II DNA or RNA helicase